MKNVILLAIICVALVMAVASTKKIRLSMRVKSIYILEVADKGIVYPILRIKGEM